MKTVVVYQQHNQLFKETRHGAKMLKYKKMTFKHHNM